MLNLYATELFSAAPAPNDNLETSLLKDGNGSPQENSKSVPVAFPVLPPSLN